MAIDLKSSENNIERCALEIRDDGIAYARISRNKQNLNSVILKEYGFYSCDDTFEQIANTLITIAKKHKPEGIVCSWVLFPKYYHLLLTNVPNVPQEEYKDALRWQIKDRVSYPIDDVALDIFLPDSFGKIDPPKLYVIASQSSFLQKIAVLLKESNFNLQTIDIKEFAIRNLITAIPNITQPIGFLHATAHEYLFTIMQNNQLYFARHISITADANQPEYAFTKLNEEIQKSLDYYTSELKQELPKAFLLSPSFDINSQLFDTLTKHIQIPFSSLPLNNIIQIENQANLNTDLIKRCYIAIGGAMRQDEVK